MKIRQWFVLALVALAFSAVPVSAQFLPREPIGKEPDSGGTTYYDLGRYLENPCTAVTDWVFVSYDVYLTEEHSDTNDRFRFAEDMTMSGGYAAGGTSRSDVAYTAPFTLRKYHKVNTSDNFHVVTVINFDPATRSTTTTVETACGNGMPDSAQ